MTMPRGKQPSAHDELARLRDEAARANVNVRELSVEFERAKAVVDSAAGDLREAYAGADDGEVGAARAELEEAEAAVVELAHRVGGAELRSERAAEAVQRFEHERAGDLLAEAEASATENTLALQRSVTETVRDWRQYKADRSRIQELVARIEPGQGATNGPPASCSLERELGALERAVRLGEELEPPLPRWAGQEWRRREDAAARRLREERRERGTQAALG
jgi:hypothetical protein